MMVMMMLMIMMLMMMMNDDDDEDDEATQAGAIKSGHIEKRLMFHNVKPSEIIRQLEMVWDQFMPNGDPTWPLRTVRQLELDYVRTLSQKYSILIFIIIILYYFHYY